MRIRAPRKRFVSLRIFGRRRNGKTEEKLETQAGQAEKNKDFEEHTPMVNHFGWRMQKKKTKRMVEGKQKLLEPLLSAGTVKPLPSWERSLSDTVSSPYDMERHAKKCIER